MSAQPVKPGLQDVQGNILSGYKNANCATYLFYRVDLPELARKWLIGLIPQVTTEQGAGISPQKAMLNIAVTFQGFKALGVSPNSLNSFPGEFRDGMKKRAAVLGDFGESDPQNWEDPLGSLQVHVLVLIHGADRKTCVERAKEVNGRDVPEKPFKEQVNPELGVTLLSVQKADGLPDHREHFGFRDGISQPWIEGTNPGPPIEPHGGKRIVKDGKRGWAPLKLGEFFLGYEDELGRVPAIPTPVQLGSNGTYLVLRKLRQRVASFNDHLRSAAKYVFGTTKKADVDRMGALMVGRWKSGCPVHLSPEQDDPGIAQDPKQVNAFMYDQNPADPDGKRCPVGAHIRRTNPRDLEVTKPDDKDEKVTLVVEPMSTRHRMIRRGLPYGPELKDKADDGKDRGMMFIALVADIGRQFEFIQQNWINDGDPFSLDATDRDPLIGNNQDERDAPTQDTYRVQSEILVQALNKADITGKVTKVTPKPITVEYEYEPSPGTDVSRIVAQAENLVKALSVDGVKITPRLGGKKVIVEVPTFKETKRKFTVPAATRIPWALNLPEFVTTKGGEYFFMPSVTALMGLARGGFSSFLAEYLALERILADPVRGTVDPMKLAINRAKLISGWLIYRPLEMLDELLKHANGPMHPLPPIFQMDGYSAPGLPEPLVQPIAIVTKYDDVREVLDRARHETFSVELYREKMVIPQPRSPRGPFILGMETGEQQYKDELKILNKAVQGSPPLTDPANIRVILEQILDPIFNEIAQRPPSKSGGIPLDVIQDIAWKIPLGLNDKYFGVPGPDPETFKRWLRDIYKELFLNLRKDPEWTKEADKAASEMNPYLDGLIQQTAQQLNQGKDTVLKALIKASGNLPPGLAPNFVRRNLMGLTVGTVETTLKAIARTIDQLIRRPEELNKAQAAARADQADVVLQYALEAMRFNPQNHVLFRLCTEDTTIAAGTRRETVIKKGTLVFASTLSAMFDPDADKQLRGVPSQFKPARHLIADTTYPNSSPFLFFGYDGHECMGRYLVPIVLQEVLVRLLNPKQLKKFVNLRRANDDPFDPIDLLPEHFLLEFVP